MSAQPLPETDAAPVLNFPGGVVGFPDAHHFALVPLGDAAEDGIFRLVSLEHDLEFVVAAPPVFFPDYDLDVADDVVDRLGLTAATTVTLVMVTLGEPVAASTANLLAPIVVNISSQLAAQVVLTGTTHPVRRPLLVA